MHQDRLPEWLKWLAEVVIVATLYVVTGKLGFLLAMPPGNVTAVWIPSGLALAAILLRGYRIWPGIWLGAFLVNSWFFSEVETSPFVAFLLASLIGAGSLFQAMIGAWLIERWIGVENLFARTEAVFKFFAVEFISCIVAPSIGVTTLFLGKFVPKTEFAYTWWTWWLGDLIGILVITPLVLVWAQPPAFRWTARHLGEAAFLIGLLALIGNVLFNHALGKDSSGDALAFMLIPFTAWAAFRFGERGVTLSTFVISVMAILGTIHGLGPFTRETLNESLSLLQVFVGTLTMTGLVLAAAVTQQQRKEDELSDLSARKTAMLEVALDCVITADDKGRIIDFNPAAERTFGYRKDEVIGRELAETIIPPSLRERHRQGFARYRATGAGPALEKRLELTGMRANGSEFAIEMTIHAITVGGKPFFTAYLRDITERKVTEGAQRKLAAIVESSDDAIIGKTLEGIITSWNTGAERIYGYRPDEILGRRITTLMPEDRIEELTVILKRLKEDEHIQRFETVRVRKDGKQINVSITMSPIKDAAGEIIGISTIARDITERKRHEEALRRSEERFRAFMDNSPAIAFIKDVAGRYVYANATFLTMFSRSLEELKEKTDYDVWAPDTAKQLRENDVAVLNANKTIQMFETIPTPDGVPHHWLVYKFPILDVSGQRFLGGVALDVTERRKLEAAREQLRSQYQEAVEKIATLSGFLPICASCKKIRDDKGYWQQVEDYISEHSEAEFSHGICPECTKKLYPDLNLGDKNRRGTSG